MQLHTFIQRLSASARASFQAWRWALVIGSAAALVACGGGGGGVVTPPGDGAPPDVADPGAPPAPSGLSLAAPNIKTLNFQWNAVAGATHYKLLEDLDGAGTASAPTEVTASIAGTQFGHEVPLYARLNASYTVKACNALGCSASSAPYALQAADLNAAIGYAKAPNGGLANDAYGLAIALSKDGNTLAVGAPFEDTGATDSGAVYVMRRVASGQWTGPEMIKDNTPTVDENFGYSLALSADGSVLAVGVPYDQGPLGTNGGAVRVFVFNTATAQFDFVETLRADIADTGDEYGLAVALSDDGNVLAVGAPGEDSSTVLGAFNDDNSDRSNSGAVYVYRRTLDPHNWDFQHALKASNAGSSDYFGVSIALSGNGLTLAVGAWGEDSNATGMRTNILDPAFTNDDAVDSGAVYVFSRPSTVQNFGSQVYIKASNSGASDYFGQSMALSQDGSVLAVGAHWESSSATGINGNGALNDAPYSGAAYIFVRNNATGDWTQQAYIKASNTSGGARFGVAVALSSDGNTLAVGANIEKRIGVGVGAEPQDIEGAGARGAVYVFRRSADGVWSQSAYVKSPSQTTSNSLFGASLALSGDGGVLAVGNYEEDHQAPAADYPIVGAPESDNNSRTDSGAVYIF